MNYADIIQVTDHSVLFGFELDAPGFAVLTMAGQEYRSEETPGVGRFEIGDLKPDTAYTAQIAGKELNFRTLPSPAGPELFRFAIIADPHISLKKEDRKGRFFAESAGLLRDALEQAQEEQAQFILMPGDITNAALEEEYRTASRILKTTPLPLMLLPGNHDHPERGSWEKFFGARRWRKTFRNVRFLAVDTSAGTLFPEDASAIEEALKTPAPLVIATHYHFFEAPLISHNPCLGIRNQEEYAGLLEKLKHSNAVILAGHQNIVSAFSCGNALQLNLPQIVQFPCAFVMAAVYGNGIRFTSIPIRSEILRQWSRKAGDAAAAFYGEKQWLSAYRYSAYDQCNFFWKGNFR